MRGLHGNTFIIAGGATGIGAGTAKRLTSEGANVAVGDINISGAKADRRADHWRGRTRHSGRIRPR